MKNHPFTGLIISLIIASAIVLNFGTSSISNDEITFEKLQKHKLIKKKRDLKKFDKPMEAIKFYYEQRAFPLGYIPEGWRESALEHIQKYNQPKPFQKTTALNWTQVGPNNIAGRVRSIVIDPNNSNTMYIGSVSGGVWKTTNGGTSWFPLKDNMENLAVCALAMDPNNSNIIYAGTGEGFFNVDAVRGAGIFKTTDAGATWTQLSSTNNYQFYYVNDLQFDPSTNRLYAATSYGLYYTSDNGNNWNAVYGADNGPNVNVTDIEIANTSPSTIYAGFGIFSQSNIYRSTNGGNNFSSFYSISGTGRIEIAVAPSNPQIIYASFHNRTTHKVSHFIKSTNGGASFTNITVPGPSLSADNYAGQQAWYNNIVAVHPTNPNIIYAGGVDLFKSTNGGTNWTQITNWYTGTSIPYVHADFHAIVFHPSNPNTVYVGTDAGISRTTNGGTNWVDLNDGLEITQFYYGAVHPSSDIFYGGTQDNGTLKSSSGLNWTMVFGGDGGATEVDFNSPSTVYTEYVYLAFFKSTNAGVSWTKRMSGIPVGSGQWDGTTDRCLFIAPFVMDPNNSQNIVAGTYKVYKTTNGATSWAAISSDLTGDGSGTSGATISALAIQKGNSNVIYAGCSNGRVQVTTNNGSNWVNRSTGLPTAYVTDIECSPTTQGVAYVTFSGFTANAKVYKTTNYGANWTNISSGLPNVPVNCIAINPDNTSQLFVGTDLGIFSSDNDGGSWVTNNNGLANVRISDLDYRASDKTLFAATHGRSMYKAQLSGGTGGTILNLVYDDGTPTSGYYWSAANTGSCNRMTPTVPSAQVIQMGIYFTGINAGSGNYKPIILGKSAGKPGSNLATLPNRIASPPGWDDFDLTSYNITVTDEFYVGLLYDGVNRPAFGYDPTDNGRAWDNGGSGWTAWNETYFMRAKIKTTTSIADLDNRVPKEFSISQNFPNPFNPQTKINYSLPKGEYVKIKVYDLNGKEVAELVNNYQSPGTYSVEWNGKNNSGQQVSSGIYFYQIEAGKYKEIKKMTLIK